MEDQEKNYYHSLYEIAAAINSAVTQETILHTIVENIAKNFNAKGCSLMLLTPDKKLLLHTVSYGLSSWFVRKGPVSADKSIAEALQGHPVAVMDATWDDRVQYKQQVKQEGIASILSVPILLRDEIMGVIRVYTAEPYRFTEADIYFARAVANLGAIALENARLYDTMKKDYEELRLDIAEWRAALGYEWASEEPVMPSRE